MKKRVPNAVPLLGQFEEPSDEAIHHVDEFIEQIKAKKLAEDYAERVCNGQFPITYTREQVVKHTSSDFEAGYIARSTEITPKQLAAELFKIHTHVGMFSKKNESEIVYREKDVVALLVKLGHPTPDFNLTEEDLKNIKL